MNIFHLIYQQIVNIQLLVSDIFAFVSWFESLDTDFDDGNLLYKAGTWCLYFVTDHRYHIRMCLFFPHESLISWYAYYVFIFINFENMTGWKGISLLLASTFYDGLTADNGHKYNNNYFVNHWYQMMICLLFSGSISRPWSALDPHRVSGIYCCLICLT
jgi:hypothetical protein